MKAVYERDAIKVSGKRGQALITTRLTHFSKKAEFSPVSDGSKHLLTAAVR